jgi:hypothetical protein
MPKAKDLPEPVPVATTVLEGDRRPMIAVQFIPPSDNQKDIRRHIAMATFQQIPLFYTNFTI